MTALNNLEQAKQGNAKAIAILINKTLQSKGVTVAATKTGSCLSVIAESQSVPDQAAIVDFIQQGISNLKPSSINQVVVQGKVIGQEQPAWRRTVELLAPQSQASKSLNTIVSTPTVQKDKLNRLGWIVPLRNYANTLLLGGILLTLLVSGWNAGHSNDQLWEYKVEGVSDEMFDIRMQQAGAYGWELASARRAVSGEGEYSEGLYEVILKRRITAAQAKQNTKAVAEELKRQGLQGKQSMAELYIGTINRSQQAYFLEHNSFSSSLAGLDLTFESQTEDYIYSISLEGQGKAIVTAASKSDELQSYTGAVVFAGRTTETIVCRSDAPSKTAPAAPTVNGSQLECAASSSKPD